MSASKKSRIIAAAAALLLGTGSVHAAQAKYQDDTMSFTVNYTDSIVPGDAVFVRLSFQPQKAHRKNRNEQDRHAWLRLMKDRKRIDQAVFYQCGKNSKRQDFLCGIPLSTWLDDGQYTLSVTISLSREETKEFSIAVPFRPREFGSERLPLDSRNSQIKSDNSPERAAQIQKLNDILFTSVPADVYASTPFALPVDSDRYTAHFGDRRIYEYTNGKSSTGVHFGNDYGVPEGTPVKASAGGKVVMAEERLSTGFSVVIEHLPGLYSLYYHLSSMSVKEGDTVRQGELIGKSGSTGLATGPHLHWEMRLNGCAVRPEFFTGNFAFSQDE